MKFTKESILKSLNSLTMPAWIKRVFQLIVDYIDDAASSINNKADLVDGKVPIEQLPSYVDDVVEFQSIISYSGLKGTIGNAAYKDKLFFVSTDPYKNKFVNTKDNTAESDWEIIDPEDGKIYINTTDNHSYRWTGSTLLDLDKDFSNGINTLNNIVKVAYIGIVNNLDDIAEGDQTGLNQTGMGQLFSFLINYKLYRNTYIEFENEDTDSRLCRIIDINGGQRQFTIYNKGALQTYKALNTGGKYSLEKINDIPGYVYFDYNDVDNNKAVLSGLKTSKTVPAILVNNIYISVGFCTKTNDNYTWSIFIFENKIITRLINNNTGSIQTIKEVNIADVILYDDIKGSKTKIEAKQELTNILAGDTVVLDYNNVGQALDNNTIDALKKANSIILLNDDGSRENSKSIYNIVARTNTYLYFCRVQNLESNGASLGYNQLTVNLTNSVWNIDLRKFTLPYGAFVAEGYTGKSQVQVNKEIANVSLLNSYKITTSDLNKELTGDKLENIKNATYLILDEGAGKTKIFARGYTSTGVIYYNCIGNSASVNYIILRMPSNHLSSIENVQFDDIMFSNYRAKGGTKANKDAMYKELIAQLTENTYVLDSSKLNTVLTNEEDTAILNATTIIVSNYPNNKPMVFIRGYDQTSQISFLNTSESVDGSVVFNKLKYIKDSKIASIAASVANPYQWYATHGGTIKDQSNFESINAFLYDRTYIIDKTLLNTTITDISIQDSIKRANILVIEDSTDSSYKVCIRGFVSTNSIYFFNLQNANADNITATRVQFNTTTNLLSSNDVYLQSAFNAYKLGGGTKYTTESAFNTQFAKVIDMTVTQ